MTAAALVQKYFEFDDYIKSETKRFNEHLATAKNRREEIRQKLHALLQKDGLQNSKTDHGTAYFSTTMTAQVNDRDTYLHFCVHNCAKGGNELLQVGTPQVDAMKSYLEDHEGKLPPGTDVSYFTQVNVRRS